MEVKTTLKAVLAYLAVALTVAVTAYFTAAEGESINSVPIVVSVLLLVPIFLWYKNYRKKTQLSKELKRRSKNTVFLWIFGLLILALSVRIPSVLLFNEPYEKTPLILLTLMTILVIEKTDASAFGFTTKKLGASLLYGLTFFILLNTLSLALIYLLTYVFTSQVPFQSYNPLPSLAAMPFMTLCVGISEEGLFRGYMQTHLERILTTRKAIFIQALLFGFWHFVWNLSPLDLLAMAQYVGATFFIGLFFGYFYSKVRSLVPVIFAHGLWNSVARGVIENQAAFDALGATSPATQILTFALPYLVAGFLTLLFVRYFVKRINGI